MACLLFRLVQSSGYLENYQSSVLIEASIGPQQQLIDPHYARELAAILTELADKADWIDNMLRNKADK